MNSLVRNERWNLGEVQESIGWTQYLWEKHNLHLMIHNWCLEQYVLDLFHMNDHLIQTTKNQNNHHTLLVQYWWWWWCWWWCWEADFDLLRCLIDDTGTCFQDCTFLVLKIDSVHWTSRFLLLFCNWFPNNNFWVAPIAYWAPYCIGHLDTPVLKK